MQRIQRQRQPQRLQSPPCTSQVTRSSSARPSSLGFPRSGNIWQVIEFVIDQSASGGQLIHYWTRQPSGYSSIEHILASH